MQRLKRFCRSGLSEAEGLRAIFLSTIFGLGALSSMQDDSWWQLRSGQLIFETLSVPRYDSFSFALPPGTAWPNHEWLSQILFYGAYRLGGLALLTFFCGIIVACAGHFLLRCMRGNAASCFLICMAALPWLRTAFSVRPQIFTLLCIAIELWLLLSGRLRWLPMLFLLWANLHAGVAVGGVILLVFAASAWGHKSCSGKGDSFAPPPYKLLLCYSALCAAVSTLTPLGLNIFTFPLECSLRSRALDLAEWRSPGFSSAEQLYFWVITIGFAWLTYRSRSRLRSWPILPLVASTWVLFGFGMASVRHISVAFVLALVTASLLLESKNSSAQKAVFSRKNTAPALVYCAVWGAVIAWAYGRPWSELNWKPLPEALIAELDRKSEPLFNSYNVGGYLLWHRPGHKVFIDSRQDPYPLELLQRALHAQRTGEYQELFAQFGFRSALMEHYWPLRSALIADGWREVYNNEELSLLTNE